MWLRCGHGGESRGSPILIIHIGSLKESDNENSVGIVCNVPMCKKKRSYLVLRALPVVICEDALMNHPVVFP